MNLRGVTDQRGNKKKQSCDTHICINIKDFSIMLEFLDNFILWRIKLLFKSFSELQCLFGETASQRKVNMTRGRTEVTDQKG